MTHAKLQIDTKVLVQLGRLKADRLLISAPQVRKRNTNTCNELFVRIMGRTVYQDVYWFYTDYSYPHNFIMYTHTTWRVFQQTWKRLRLQLVYTIPMLMVNA